MTDLRIVTRPYIPSLVATPTGKLPAPIRREATGLASDRSVSATVQARYQMTATRREEAVFAYRIKIGDWVGFGYVPADSSDSRSFEARVEEVLRMAKDVQANARHPGGDSVELDIWTADAENPMQIIGQSVAAGALSVQVGGQAEAMAGRPAELLPEFLARAEPSVLTLGWAAANNWSVRQVNRRDSFLQDLLT